MAGALTVFDGSEMIGLSPHGKKVLEKLPVVGKLKE